MDSQLIAIPLTALAMLTTLTGGLVALRMSDSLPTMIALSGGIVVAVALFDVLPEAIDLLPGDSTDIGALMGAGFLTFFLFERVLVLHHRDEPADARAHHQVGTFGALGLSAHSFVDGLAIGLAFGANTSTGVLVLVAVLAHDFADGLNTVNFVLNQSQNRPQAIRWLAADAVRPSSGPPSGCSSTCPMPPSGTCCPYRWVLPLHGSDRSLAGGPQARVVGPRRADAARVRGDLRDLLIAR